MEGQIDLKGGAFTGRAIHPDVSVALFHDSVDCGETEAGTFAALFSSEERLEDVSEDPRVHACSCVDHGKAYVVSHAGTGMRPRILRIEMRVCGLNLELAAVGHGVARIDSKIHDDLVDLALVGLHTAKRSIQRE